MTIKASVTITISKYRDTDSITRFYKLQASTASAPAIPTTLTPPSGWSTTEPTYTSGSTNTLYFTDRYIFSDGTFQYTDDGNSKAVKSSSYEAAKEAYNKAKSAQDSIDNIEIGGRNLIFQSSLKQIPDSNANWILRTVNNVTSSTFTDDGLIVTTPKDIGTYYNGASIKFNNINDIIPSGQIVAFSIDIKGDSTTNVSITGLYRGTGNNFWDHKINIIRNVNNVDKDTWTRYKGTFTMPDVGTLDKALYIDLVQSMEGITRTYKNAKLERGNKPTDWTPAPEDNEEKFNYIQSNYLQEKTFTSYKDEQLKKDDGIERRLQQTSVTIYGSEDGTVNPNSETALVNQIEKIDSDVNGQNGALNRIEAAENTIEGTGLNEYDQTIKITQRFRSVEDDVNQIKNTFKITGGTNLIQNSVGYFYDTENKPTMWSIANNTIFAPFGYDADLVGSTASRGKLFCAKGSITTTLDNIVLLLSNTIMSISFKYKNGSNARSKIKIFNGSVTYFEKTFTASNNQWMEYTYDPENDPKLANPSFVNTSNSLQISIESSNSTDNKGIEISDLMLNYGDIKPWELSNNEVYGAMVKLSNLGIEVTATAANTKNFMTTDGILVYKYDSVNDRIIGTEAITKITDNGTLTNKLESTGDIIERDLVHTTIKDSSNNDIYVEYIRD